MIFTKKILTMCCLCMAFTAFSLPVQSFANEESDERSINLPAPDTKGSVSLMQALSERKSTRSLSNEALSQQDISNILWAAFGTNRKDGKRTIPTAHNKQNVALYVFMKGFIWIYDAESNAIHKLIETDLAGSSKGAMTLIIAAEGDAKTDYYGNMHTGSLYQNVGLYCATAGLGNVVHASGVDKTQEIIAPYLPTAYTVRMLQSIGKMK